ncbi:MAG: dethiobiotin synthase [Methylococcaceae bacterium]|nr:MAG: dethiobiotin synthase [Methylococcaceae bacterium]
MTDSVLRRGFFVTGTDTGVGKTWVSVALLRALRRAGVPAVGMKPVATGCRMREGVLVNDDALLLQANGALVLDYRQVNPYAFAPAVAPHIAAKLAGERIDYAVIAEQYNCLQEIAGMVVVEGVGGWLVPLNETEDVAGLAGRLGLPVILVVGLRLGCINHALLTAKAIVAAGCVLAGWVGNTLDPAMDYAAENLAALAECVHAPCLAVLPYVTDAMRENGLNQAETALLAGLGRSGLLQSHGA